MRAASLSERKFAPPYARLALVLPLLLLADLLILTRLRSAPALLGELAALAGALWLLRKGERALAFIAVGMPLLEPVLGQFALGNLGLIVSRLLLIGALAVLPLRGLLGLTREKGRSSFALLLEPTMFFALLLGVVYSLGLRSTPAPEYGGGKVFGYFVFVLPLLFGAALLLARPAEPEVERERHHRFLAMILWLEVLLALAGVHNYVTHYYPWRFRLVSLGMNPIWVGRHAGQGLLLVIGFVSVGWMRRGVGTALAVLLAAVLWWSGSRGVLLAFIVALGFWLLGDKRLRRWVPLALVLGGAAVALVLLSLTSQGGTVPFLNRADSNVSRARLFDIARRTISGIGFSGVGTGGFAGLARVGDVRYYPHNLFLEIGLENGIPGVAALLAFLSATLLAARRGFARLLLPDAGARLRLAIALFIFQFVNAQFSGDVTANEWIWLWSGVILAFARAA